MLIWVLGAGGLIGQFLQQTCEKKGISHIASLKNQVDIRSFEDMEKFVSAHRPSHVINCAAYTNVDQAEKEPELAYAVNALGPYHLGLLGKKYGMRVLHLSTDYVFDGKKGVCYEETALCLPLNVYGETKKKGEEGLLSVYPEACILRTSWVFAKGGKNFFSTLHEKIKNEAEIRTVSDQWNRLTYCPDLIKVIFSLLDQSGIFHFANEGICSRFDLAEAIFTRLKQLKISIKCNAVTAVSGDQFLPSAVRPKHSVLSTKKIESILNFKPRHWKEAVQEFLNLSQ